MLQAPGNRRDGRVVTLTTRCVFGRVGDSHRWVGANMRYMFNTRP